MLLRLKSLNESFEKKYQLNEKFDDSMPKWLKDRLAFNALETSLSHAYNKDGKVLNRWQAPRAKFPDYSAMPDTTASKQRGGSYNVRDYGLMASFIDAGIDVSKLKVTEAPIPSRVPKHTVNQQFIPIFLLDTGQVWAKGINDRERFSSQYGTPAFDYDLNDKPFKSIKSEDIIKHCVAYCYAEDSDADAVRTVGDTRESRKVLKQELLNIPNYSRSQNPTQLSSLSYDKSGYRKISMADKYASELKEIKRNKNIKSIATDLEKCATLLDNYKEILVDMLGDVEVPNVNSESTTDFSEVWECASLLKDAGRKYVSVLENAKKIDDPQLYTWEKEDAINSALRGIAITQNYLDDIESKIGDRERAIVDWI